MPARRARTLLAVAAVALALGSCGGDDDDDDGASGGAVTKEQFIERADAICEETNASIQAAVTDVADDASNRELADAALSEVVPRFRGQVEQLRDLDLPEADVDQLEQLWDDLDASIDELEQKLEDDPDGAFATDFDPFGDESEFATDYGFTACGS